MYQAFRGPRLTYSGAAAQPKMLPFGPRIEWGRARS
jgi:hypothetical protein